MFNLVNIQKATILHCFIIALVDVFVICVITNVSVISNEVTCGTEVTLAPNRPYYLAFITSSSHPKTAAMVLQFWKEGCGQATLSERHPLPKI